MNPSKSYQKIFDDAIVSKLNQFSEAVLLLVGFAMRFLLPVYMIFTLSEAGCVLAIVTNWFLRLMGCTVWAPLDRELDVISWLFWL
ncbi:MAG: hypothetical protein ACPHO8_12085 [Mariniblastus sp.]